MTNSLDMYHTSGIFENVHRNPTQHNLVRVKRGCSLQEAAHQRGCAPQALEKCLDYSLASFKSNETVCFQINYNLLFGTCSSLRVVYVLNCIDNTNYTIPYFREGTLSCKKSCTTWDGRKCIGRNLVQAILYGANGSTKCMVEENGLNMFKPVQTVYHAKPTKWYAKGLLHNAIWLILRKSLASFPYKVIVFRDRWSAVQSQGNSKDSGNMPSAVKVQDSTVRPNRHGSKSKGGQSITSQRLWWWQGWWLWQRFVHALSKAGVMERSQGSKMATVGAQIDANLLDVVQEERMKEPGWLVVSTKQSFTAFYCNLLIQLGK